MDLISEGGRAVVKNIPCSRPPTHQKMKSSFCRIENSLQSKNKLVGWEGGADVETARPPIYCTPKDSPDNVDKPTYLPHFGRAKYDVRKWHFQKRSLKKKCDFGDNFENFSAVNFIHCAAKLCLRGLTFYAP